MTALGHWSWVEERRPREPTSCLNCLTLSRAESDCLEELKEAVVVVKDERNNPYQSSEIKDWKELDL
jgi:hypothetical protein